MASPCRLYIGGGAGTGKSHVARAIISLIACPCVLRRGGREKALVCAFQGKQATTLGGTTIHSIASVPDENSQTPARRLSPKKKALWKDVTVLIIEEVSMVSAKMLAALHVAAVASLGADASLPFGGLDIVALGDFSQLQQVASKGLASGFSKDIGAAVLASSSSSAFGGQQLFLSMTAWVMLVQSKRFTEPLRGIVERLRLGSCTSEDRDILNSTTIGAGNI
ncbi:unnamed protein product, partial [Ectocarpus sp. 12 AP-2014]